MAAEEPRLENLLKEDEKEPLTQKQVTVTFFCKTLNNLFYLLDNRSTRSTKCFG